jgi:hypothetical protein
MKLDIVQFYIGLIMALGSASYAFFAEYTPALNVILILGIIFIATSKYRLLK